MYVTGSGRAFPYRSVTAPRGVNVPPMYNAVSFGIATTAAGDAFTAGLAVTRAEGKPFAEAVRLANAAGALCCRGLGAQPSLPTRGEVEGLLAGLASA